MISPSNSQKSNRKLVRKSPKRERSKSSVSPPPPPGGSGVEKRRERSGGKRGGSGENSPRGEKETRGRFYSTTVPGKYKVDTRKTLTTESSEDGALEIFAPSSPGSKGKNSPRGKRRKKHSSSLPSSGSGSGDSTKGVTSVDYGDRDDTLESLQGPTTMFRLLGYLLPFTSIVFYWAQSFTINLLLDRAGITPLNQFLIRGFQFILCSKAGILAQKINHRDQPVQDYNYSKLRAALFLVVDMIMYNSLLYLSLQTMIVLFFTFPVFVPFISRFLLNEKIDIASIVALIACFVGIIFVVQPPFIFPNTTSSEDTSSYVFYIACLVMILDGLLMGFILTHSRKKKANVSVFLVHDNYGVYCVLASTFILAIIYQEVGSLTALHILLILLGNGFGYLAMYLQYISVKYQKATIVGLISYIQIPITYVAEILFNDLEVHLFDIMGGIIITFSALTLNVYKYWQEVKNAKNDLALIHSQVDTQSTQRLTDIFSPKYADRRPLSSSQKRGSPKFSHKSNNKSPSRSPKSLSPPRSPRNSKSRSPSRSPNISPSRSPNISPNRSPSRSPNRSPNRSPKGSKSPPRSPRSQKSPRSPKNQFKTSPISEFK